MVIALVTRVAPADAAPSAVAVDQAAVLLDGLPAVGAVAVTADGRLVCRIDERRGAIVGFDPLDPATRRDAVGPVPPGGAVPVEIAFVDESVIAAVCRSGDDWSLRTWRLAAGETVDAGSPLQELPLGRAAGSAEGVRMAASRLGDWLAIAGLPPPLPQLERRAVAGVRVGPATPRSCPRIASDTRVVAVAAGPADELVLFERPASGGADVVSFHGPSGGCLLRLDTGLHTIRDAVCGIGNGLWVTAGDSASPEEQEGLWRLDARLDASRQAIRPVLVVGVPKVGAIAAAGRMLVVGHGRDGSRLVQIDQATDGNGPSRPRPAADPPEAPVPGGAR